MVVAVRYSSRPFRASRGLAWAGGFGAAGVGLSALYATTGVGLACPFLALTGWQCPFCGGTRLGSALLHGHLLSAFAANPVVLVGLALLGVLALLWTAEVLGGPAVRLPVAWSARLRAVSLTRWLVLGLSAAAVDITVRNLL